MRDEIHEEFERMRALELDKFLEIKKCFNDQGIKIKNDAIKLIEKKSG